MSITWPWLPLFLKRCLFFRKSLLTHITHKNINVFVLSVNLHLCPTMQRLSKRHRTTHQPPIYPCPLPPNQQPCHIAPSPNILSTSNSTLHTRKNLYNSLPVQSGSRPARTVFPSRTRLWHYSSSVHLALLSILRIPFHSIVSLLDVMPVVLVTSFLDFLFIAVSYVFL